MGKHGQESAGAADALRAAGGVARRGRGDRFSVGRKSEAGRCCMKTLRGRRPPALSSGA